MTQEPERWIEIVEFPGYAVSDHGRVMNKKRGNDIRITKNGHGYAQVGMMKNGSQQKKSLSLLVAVEFLPAPEHESFDTPIHLDGNKENCHYANLMWRPKWFARRYMRQFGDDHPTHPRPIEDIETGQRYGSSMEAATTHGLLDVDIYLGMMQQIYVWPTKQTFRKILES